MAQVLLDTTPEKEEAELGIIQRKTKKKDHVKEYLSKEVADLLAQARKEGLLHSDGESDDNVSLEDEPSSQD